MMYQWGGNPKEKAAKEETKALLNILCGENINTNMLHAYKRLCGHWRKYPGFTPQLSIFEHAEGLAALNDTSVFPLVRQELEKTRLLVNGKPTGRLLSDLIWLEVNAAVKYNILKGE